VDKVALGQVFSEYFGFPCQSSFHKLLHNHPHLSSGAGTIGQKWPHPTSNKKIMERFNLKKLNEVEGKEQYRVEISKRFTALGNY
jgi:hypothetical protein